MIVELGHFALVLAFSLAVVQFAVPLAGAQFGDPRLTAVAGPTAMMCFLFTLLSFVALTLACGFRGDRAHHSELIARNVPRIARAAFRFDRAQCEVGLA